MFVVGFPYTNDRGATVVAELDFANMNEVEEFQFFLWEMSICFYPAPRVYELWQQGRQQFPVVDWDWKTEGF